MTIEERLEAIEKETAALQASVKELKEAGTVGGYLQSRQESAVKDHREWLEELTKAQQNHAEWLQSHERAMQAHTEAVARHDREMAEIRKQHQETEDLLRKRHQETDELLRKLGKDTDERIANLVSAIGDFIRGRNPKQES